MLTLGTPAAPSLVHGRPATLRPAGRLVGPVRRAEWPEQQVRTFIMEQDTFVMQVQLQYAS